MNTDEPASAQINAAVEKFYLLNDDLDKTQAVARKVFFEFLRTNPTLSSEEIDIIRTYFDLVAELCKAKRTQQVA